jgi:replication fork clamp-binding protein CrfC
MSSKEELLHLIEKLDERWVDDVADYVRWLQQPTDTLSPVEFQRVQQGEQELVQGDRISLKDWRRQHDV